MTLPRSYTVAALVALLLFAATGNAADYPQETLANKAMTLTVLLPDAKTGYYRGSRFDWTGVVSKVEYDGHTLFQEWKSPHNPEGHDDVGGTAEEFGMLVSPLGYADAKASGTFLKIGIGRLEKPDDKEYQFFRNYKVAEPAKTEVTVEKRQITFRQEATHDGYAYEYVKRIVLEDGSGFRIERQLKNTGKKTIHTDHYGHNFISFDHKPVGPDYRLTLKKKPMPRREKTDFGQFAAFDGASITFKKPLKNGTIYTELDGLADEAALHRVTVQDAKTGFGVTITGDAPLKEMHVWGIETALCPEPFVEMKLAPGELKAWKTRYEVFVKKP